MAIFLLTRYAGPAWSFLRGSVALFAGLVLAAQVLATPSSAEDRRIERLIAQVAVRADILFIRNGQVHDAQAAVDHLRLKWRRGREAITTAEEFVTVLASRSSVSGKPYLIRFSDGREVTAQAWLMEELRRADAQAPGKSNKP